MSHRQRETPSRLQTAGTHVRPVLAHNSPRIYSEKVIMSSEKDREFPRWETLYDEQEIESMPWFNPVLDEDLKDALDKLGMRRGSALDLGTGPGTQAMHLAARGFDVTATDISETAIRLESETATARGLRITWKQDDILNSRLDQPFDLIFDRGCFHVLAPEQREDYVRTVSRLLNAGGYLAFKCFSRQQPGEQGPYRFTLD